MQPVVFGAADYKRLLPLLLEADPCESIVQSYFSQCFILGFCDEKGPCAEACVLPLCPTQCELKNLAVRADLRGKGVGGSLCRRVFAVCAAKGFQTITVGTADVPGSPVPFYESLGFQRAGLIADFFVRRYPAPVYDGPHLCRDMILLRRSL